MLSSKACFIVYADASVHRRSEFFFVIIYIMRGRCGSTRTGRFDDTSLNDSQNYFIIVTLSECPIVILEYLRVPLSQ